MSKHYNTDIDIMFAEIKSKIEEQVSEANKETIKSLTKENADLKETNKLLFKAAQRTKSIQENSELINLLIDRLKNRIQEADGQNKEKLVYDFLDCFLDKDFNENTYEVPLWLGCAIQYYSNRDIIFKILKTLDIRFPGNLESIKYFRLPQDWTEEELDAVFDTMGFHVNCNNCRFEDNIRFWKTNALDDPIKVCKSGRYTEIPWQYLLRNPLLKKEKYLSKIGKMFCSSTYRPYEWLNFANITKYQELTEEEIKIIISNIDYMYYDNKNEDLKKFLLENIDLIDNEVFLEAIYKYNSDNVVLKMPYRFIKQYIRDKKDLEWIKKNKKRFTKEQITELTLLALVE